MNRIEVGMAQQESQCKRLPQAEPEGPTAARAWELAGTPGRRRLTGQRQPAAAACWNWGYSLYIRSAQLPEETLQGAAPTGRDPVLQTSVIIVMSEHLHGVQVLCSCQLALTKLAETALLTVGLLELLLQHQCLLNCAQQAGLGRCRGCHLSLGLHSTATCCRPRNLETEIQSIAIASDLRELQGSFEHVELLT